MVATRVGRHQGQSVYSAGLSLVAAQIESRMVTASRPAPAHTLVSFAQQELGVDLNAKQLEIFEAVQQHRRVAVKSCHASGKGLALDTPIPTPNGWTTMGGLRVGDQVFDESGKLCTVTFVSPVRTIPCYRVTFSDGAEIIADQDHQWSVLRYRDRATLREHQRRKGEPVVRDWRQEWSRSQTVSTPELAGMTETAWGQRDASIPMALPLDLPDAELPIDPYLLGVWLGDGHSGSGAITTADSGILAAYDHLPIPSQRSSGQASTYRIVGLTAKLRLLGVLGSKHIPAAYLRASAAQRLALLQGLMDTDGFCTLGNGVGIDLADQRLALDVAELIRSMGWATRVRFSENGHAGRYRMAFQPSMPVFRLERKRAQFREHRAQQARATHRFVVSVDVAESVPTRCIQVDSPRALYLAGREMIPTHNTYGAAALLIAFLHVYENSKVITTAPGGTHVREGLWQVVRQLYQKAPGKLLRGSPLTTKWEIAPNWFAMGFSPGTTGAARFQGHHAPHVLLIVDEAAEVERQIFEALDSLMTSDSAHILMIGNPVRTSGRFYSAFTRSRSLWHQITIKSTDTPNIIAGRTVVPGLLDQRWIDEAIEEYGPNDPFVTARVHAEFPKDDPDAFIQYSDLEAAAGRSSLDSAHGIRGGLDIARMGSDASVLVWRQGDHCLSSNSWRKADTMETVGRVRSEIEALLQSSGRSMIESLNVDLTGIGSGVYDRLRELQLENQLPVEHLNGVEFGGRSSDPTKWKMVRDEMWWTLRELARSGRLAGHISDSFIEQAAAVRARYVSTHSQPVIESKDEFRKREGRSPDDADAYCLAYYVPAAEHAQGVAVGGPVASGSVFVDYEEDDDY